MLANHHAIFPAAIRRLRQIDHLRWRPGRGPVGGRIPTSVPAKALPAYEVVVLGRHRDRRGPHNARWRLNPIV